eukprot:m.59776 g.59776  ORF g.59776 m.59776 type:complete len:764 (+) comp13018_c0_seq1:109-2400(+)
MAVPPLNLSGLLGYSGDGNDAAASGSAPSLAYTYQDAEPIDVEVSEFFSYAENQELDQGRVLFERDVNGSAWKVKSPTQQRSYIHCCLDSLEDRKPETRQTAAQRLLYIALGAYGECASFHEQIVLLHHNNVLLYQCGAFPILVQAIIHAATELEDPAHRTELGLRSNFLLRVLCDLVYLMLESFRKVMVDSHARTRRATSSPLPGSTTGSGLRYQPSLDVGHDDDHEALLSEFRETLGQPLADGRLLAAVFLDMLTSFKEGAGAVFPVKKLILLTWKTVLLSLGGSKQLDEIKAASRKEAGLPGAALSSAALLESQATLTPKASQADIDAFKESVSMRFYSFSHLEEPERRASDQGADDGVSSNTTTLPVPAAVREAVAILEKHLYVPLGEHQINEFEAVQTDLATRAPVALPLPREQTPTEVLYAALFEKLPKHTISLLRVLLAAAPAPANKKNMASRASLQLTNELNAPAADAPLVSVARDDVDEQRHKEIIIKGSSALLLLLLRHFKQNHVLQFECFSQLMVDSRCLMLILKLLNQNVETYVGLKNSIPSCELFNFLAQWRAESRTFRSEETVPGGQDGSVCARNMHAIIDLVRILQKLTKGKEGRILNLVVEKSATILKKCLRVAHPVMNLYVLKVLKSQSRFLGRAWRKSNMQVLSRIDKNVRHRLRDTWFYENVDHGGIDYQEEEDDLRRRILDFHSVYYQPPTSIAQPRSLVEEQQDLYLSQGELEALYRDYLEDEKRGMPVDIDACLREASAAS